MRWYHKTEEKMFEDIRRMKEKEGYSDDDFTIYYVVDVKK